MAGEIKVIVSGAYGRMGREVVRAVSAEKDLQLVGAFDKYGVGEDAGEAAGVGGVGVEITDDLTALLKETKPAVMVDFTIAEGFASRASKAMKAGTRLVVGTTGISPATLKRLEKTAKEKKLGVLIAPNFAIGAVLMMEFAAKAAAHMPAAEIIEMHHDAKLDAPSGTALTTAEKMSAARKGLPKAKDPTKTVKLEGARGGRLDAINVHSVRLPGFLASQEVILGALGQTLTIRHDTISRAAFMPGVVLAVKKIAKMRSYVFGLEKIL